MNNYPTWIVSLEGRAVLGFLWPPGNAYPESWVREGEVVQRTVGHGNEYAILQSDEHEVPCEYSTEMEARRWAARLPGSIVELRQP